MTFKLSSFPFATRLAAAGRAFLPGWQAVFIIAAISLYLALPGAIKKAALIFFTAAGGLIGLGATIHEITLLAARVLKAIRHPNRQKHEPIELQASEARP
ncbi:MAG: hypothetical protein WCD20_04585 [Rhodomicrobium sp.]